jgi:hypothetical protein
VVGRVVHDRNGTRIGRIHDVRGELNGSELEIVEYLLGAAALWQRIGITALRLIGVPHEPHPKRIPWDQIDISDPEKPIYLGN